MGAARNDRGRHASTVLVTTVAVLAAFGIGSPSAAADGSVVIDLEGMQPIVVQGDLTVSYPPVQNGAEAAAQCVPVPGNPTLGNLCVGSPSVGPSTPLVVSGPEDAAPVVKSGPEASSALDWIVDEAVEHLRATHDVPDDERILRYARPEIRAYLLNRLLDIVDRVTYGVPLTADEQRAFTFLQNQALAEDRELAQAAYDEFELWQRQKCSYRPPKAPTAVTDPVGLPEDVRKWCSVAHHPTAEAFVFAPPIPSVEHFTAWGAYRVAAENDLDAFGSSVMQDNTFKTAAATAVLAGAVGAGLGAAGAAALVGSSTTLAFGAAAMMGSYSVTGIALNSSLPATFAGAGVGAAASVVAIVVVFVVVTAIAIWQLIEHESVGQTLEERRDAARTSTDPMNLAPLIAELSGKPLRSELDPLDPPPYRSGASIAKLLGNVVRWTTLTPSGTPVGDPRGIWSGWPSSPGDHKFTVQVGAGPAKKADSITVPQEDGTPATVHFSRDWLVVKEPGEPPRPALSFGYTALDGSMRAAMRAPASLGGFLVAASSKSSVGGTRTDAITYRNEKGERVRVTLRPRASATLAGPRPSAVGALYAGRTVTLRPNPVELDGTSVDPVLAESDYDYAWTVQRFDEEGEQWQTVTTSSAFGPTFTSTTPGQYVARVVMTPLDDPAAAKHGSVDFTVQPPPLTTPVLALQDNGIDRLEVDLQVTEPVPTDTITVTATWPGDVGAATNPGTTVTLPCVQSGPLECTTRRTGSFDDLVRQISSRTDLHRPVTVTLTNTSGGSQTHELRLDSPERPTVAPPAAGANDGEPGSVLVGEGGTQVVMPLEDGGTANYVAGTLLPGTGVGDDFGIVDPTTGNTTANIYLPGVHNVYASVDERPDGTWELLVWGTPKPKDLGTYQVPIVLQQTNVARQLVVLTVHVVPSTGDRYRGAIQSDIDPADDAVGRVPDLRPVVLGGESDGKRYQGDMCLSLQDANQPPPASQTCGPLSEFFKKNGEARPFPFGKLAPDGLGHGRWRAHAWLTDTRGIVDNEPLGVSFFLRMVEMATPTIEGKAKVGRTLTAVVDSVAPADAALRYVWLRDGKKITGATEASYDVVKADRGHRLQVRVVATKDDHLAAKEVSAKTRRVR